MSRVSADPPVLSRLATIDLLRFFAVLAVVVQHVTWYWIDEASPDLGAVIANGALFFAVPCLLVVSGFVAGLKPFHERGRQWLRRRLGRLVVPYLAWTLVYFLLMSALTLRANSSLPPVSLSGLLTGTALYPALWFLPALGYVTILAWPLSSARRAIAGLVLSGAFWLVLGVSSDRPVPVLGSYYGVVLARCLTFYLLGMALMNERFLRFGRKYPGLGVALALSAATTSAGLNVWLVSTDASRPSQLQELLGGLVAVGLLTAAVGWQRVSFPTTVTALSLGLYLSHPLWIEAMMKAVPPGTLPWHTWIPGMSVVGFAVSYASCSLVARIRLLRPLVS